VRRGRRRADPAAIGGMIAGVLADLGHGGAATAMRIVKLWPEVVGEEAARHAEPTALRGRVLEVRADSSVWCQQLQLRRDEILAGLRDRLGAEAPGDLRLRVG
jgi:predicted nucleic acid-binding Zn ribbon protein